MAVKFEISNNQSQKIANSIFKDILEYCQNNADAFEEYKKNIKNKGAMKYETESGGSFIRKHSK